MKSKKTIIYFICFALICSLIGIKAYINKIKSTKNTVAAVDSEKNKTNNKQNNSKSTNEPNSTVSNPSNSSTPDINKLDITMIGTTPNTEGNTSGNLLNRGYFAKQGKWIYFTLPPVSTVQRPIYRAMSDGETGLKAITEPGQYYFINVIGDWVYYISSKDSYIYRTKTDGSRTEVVVDSATLNMCIKDNFIYYTSSNGIYKLRLNSTKEEKALQLAKGSNSYYICVYNNLIYTPIYELKTTDPTKNKGEVISKLYTMNLDGSNLKALSNDNTYGLTFYNNYIFYFNIDNQKLYRMNLNGSNKMQLFTFHISNYNINNNNIYFSGYEGDQYNIYKSDLEGKKIVKLTNNIYESKTSLSNSDFYINSISIIDDYIFYMGLNVTNLNLKRVKIDGSFEKQLN